MIDQKDLETSSYFYELPPELIAQRPCDGEHRDESRLLVYKKATDEVIHTTFKNIGEFLPQDSLLVFNQSKVFPSRLVGNKISGGKAEVFLLSDKPNQKGEFEVLIRARGKKKIDDEFDLPGETKAKITEVLDDGTFMVQFNRSMTLDYLEKYAKIPIPPYIRNGESDESDVKNYQTVYANQVGSVAAPTAGLHFTNDLLKKLAQKNIEQAFVTLHVGIGTFRPVTAKNIKDHQMHFENFMIDFKNFTKLKKHREEQKKIFAVGTTSLRVLESIERFSIAPDKFFQTNIFLHPGVDVQSIDGLITNFHLPESTLLILVSTLIGRKKALELYEIAVNNRYRFFSYGDAMLLVL